MELQRQESELQRQESEKKMELQRQEPELQRQESEKKMELLRQESEKKMELLLQQTANRPTFGPFDAAVEPWDDYWSRFSTYLKTNSIPKGKSVHLFLSSQLPSVYKMMKSRAFHNHPSKEVDDLNIQEVEQFMKDQFCKTQHVVRDKFNFWNDAGKESLKQFRS